MSAATAPVAVRVRPILMSAPMVRASLAGTKTQSRRVVKPSAYQKKYVARTWGKRVPTPQEWNDMAGDSARVNLGQGFNTCPYGRPGDRLWVRESHRFAESGSETSDSVHYRADPDEVSGGPWRPSIHMPRWASRITLELTAVRVQRLQEISEEDARAEGAPVGEMLQATVNGEPGKAMAMDPRVAFAWLWNSINAKRGYQWESSPWVRALTFRRVA